MPITGGLVVTTIHEPNVLEGYLDNFSKYRHLDQVRVFVIPDLKTPVSVYNYCQRLSQRGLRVQCPTLEEQESFLRKVGFPPHLVPYNSDNRRNVGYLMALETGVDFVISIDDDNFCLPEEDFFTEHSVVCCDSEINSVVTSSTGWFNPCSLLEMEPSLPVYPRGFPYYARHKGEELIFEERIVSVHINAGLWLTDPDLDALTWLVLPTHSIAFKHQSVVLDQKTWSPINTQNTALRREAVAGYYFVKMGYPLAGMGTIDRYGDIFSGYFVQACAKHLNGYSRVGSPCVEHRRNAHNYFRDAVQEWGCIMVLEDLLPALVEVKLEGRTYPETYIALSYALEEIVEQFKGSLWADATKGYFHQIAYYMRLWARVTAQFL